MLPSFDTYLSEPIHLNISKLWNVTVLSRLKTYLEKIQGGKEDKYSLTTTNEVSSENILAFRLHLNAVYLGDFFISRFSDSNYDIGLKQINIVDNPDIGYVVRKDEVDIPLYQYLALVYESEIESIRELIMSFQE